MRKILSLVMVLAMLLGTVSFAAIGAGAALEDWGYDEWPDGDDGGNQYVEAPYFETAPTLDGIISEAEWGKCTVKMYSSDAATMDNKTPCYASFFYWRNAEAGAGTEAQIEYDIWLRWNEDNFFVGVKVRDYDGHSLKQGKTNTWNGDAIQFRVDSEGVNISGDNRIPWSDDASIPDIMAGYSEIAGGFFECYDNADQSTKGLTAYSNPKWGAVQGAVAPAGDSYSADTKAGYTTYELAIPWKYIFENADYLSSQDNTPVKLTKTEWAVKNPMGAYGMELGMSLTVLNAAEGESSYNSYLSWGSGVAGTSNVDEAKNQPYATCSGSNGVVLTDATVAPQAGYPTADPSVLERAGKKAANYDEVYYDYLEFDFDRANPANNTDGFKTLTYEELDDASAEIKTSPDQEFWGSYDLYMGSVKDSGDAAHGNVLVFDRAIRNQTNEDGSQVVAGVDPIPSYYLATEYAVDAGWTFPLSYTFEFDIKYTGNEISTEGHAPLLCNWFGGSTAVDYEMGYDFTLSQFVVRERGDEIGKLDSVNYTLNKDQWYNWKFQYDNETCVARLLIDDETIFNVYNRYFYYSDDKMLENGTGLYFWFINTQVEFDNVKIYNFVDFVHQEAGNVDKDPTSGATGGNATTKPTTQEQSTEIETNVTKREDGTFVVPVFTKPLYKTATQLAYTFTYNEDKFEYVGIEGLDEKDYEIKKAEDGSYVLTIKAIDKVKAAASGAEIFKLVFKSKTGDDYDAHELVVKMKDTFKYTVATGDNMVYIVTAALVMMASATAVVVYKRRRATDLI